MTREISTDTWSEFHKRYAVLGLPQVPDASVRAAYDALVAGHDDNVLLLGMTRVLLDFGQAMTAVDLSATQIEQFWPGDSEGRRAVLGDWRDPAAAVGAYTAVIGDGSLSALTWAEDYRAVLANSAAALVPGGKLVIRCFMAPDTRETLGQIADDVHAGRERSFHAARWRIAMAATDPDGNIPVRWIQQAFRATFPDWQGLAAKTGWDHAAIERIVGSFRNSGLVYSFVTRQQVLDTLPDTLAQARFEPSGDYPLAERCPFLVAERKA